MKEFLSMQAALLSLRQFQVFPGKEKAVASSVLRFGKNPKPRQESPTLQIQEDFLSRRDLKALQDYCDANFDPNKHLPRCVDSRSELAISDFHDMSPLMTPIEFLKPAGIYTRV